MLSPQPADRGRTMRTPNAMDERNLSLARGAVAGVLATAAMDVGARLLAPRLRAQPLHPALLGRWTAHLL